MKAWEKFKAAKSLEQKKQVYEEAKENGASFEEKRLMNDVLQMLVAVYHDGIGEGLRLSQFESAK